MSTAGGLSLLSNYPWNGRRDWKVVISVVEQGVCMRLERRCARQSGLGIFAALPRLRVTAGGETSVSRAFTKAFPGACNQVSDGGEIPLFDITVAHEALARCHRCTGRERYPD